MAQETEWALAAVGGADARNNPPAPGWETARPWQQLFRSGVFRSLGRVLKVLQIS
ncbi:hypothetical protein NBG89_23810 (plasmid) [Rhizobium sp. YTU87027]